MSKFEIKITEYSFQDKLPTLTQNMSVDLRNKTYSIIETENPVHYEMSLFSKQLANTLCI